MCLAALQMSMAEAAAAAAAGASAGATAGDTEMSRVLGDQSFVSSVLASVHSLILTAVLLVQSLSSFTKPFC